MGDDRAAVTADGGVPTKQYGKNMPEFVGVTEDAFADATGPMSLSLVGMVGIQATQAIAADVLPQRTIVSALTEVPVGVVEPAGP
ncbi:MAG: hypothetical protein R2789_07750 [Microthrixaceae bacterium]